MKKINKKYLAAGLFIITLIVAGVVYKSVNKQVSDNLTAAFIIPGCFDADSDGYEYPNGFCLPSTAPDCDDDTFDDPAGCPVAPTDCDATSTLCAICINPGAAEVCGDLVDNNCDGSIDEGCPACTDNDGDGYGNPGDASCPNGAATDCDDADITINPGATEACNDSVDNDCDGQIDEGCGGNPISNPVIMQTLLGDTGDTGFDSGSSHGAASEGGTGEFPVNDKIDVTGDESAKSIEVCFMVSHGTSAGKITYMNGNIEFKDLNGADISSIKLIEGQNITEIQGALKDDIYSFKAYINRDVRGEDLDKPLRACFEIMFNNMNMAESSTVDEILSTVNEEVQAAFAEAMIINIKVDAVGLENGEEMKGDVRGGAEFKSMPEVHQAAQVPMARQWTLSIIIFLTVVAAGSYALKKAKKFI